MMNRRKFIGILSGTIVIVSTTSSYLLHDKNNVLEQGDLNHTLNPDEKQILLLTAIAMSEHNRPIQGIQPLDPYDYALASSRDLCF